MAQTPIERIARRYDSWRADRRHKQDVAIAVIATVGMVGLCWWMLTTGEGAAFHAWMAG